MSKLEALNERLLKQIRSFEFFKNDPESEDRKEGNKTHEYEINETIKLILKTIIHNESEKDLSMKILARKSQEEEKYINAEDALKALDILCAQIGNARVRKIWKEPLRKFIKQFQTYGELSTQKNSPATTKKI